MEKNQKWNQIIEQREDLVSSVNSYWREYSSFDTWQFWVVAGMLVLPIFILFFMVDRKRILELFFFGYSIHMLWSYFDVALDRSALFSHKYFLLPVLPFGINLSASAIPVLYILLYQFCTKSRRNFLLYSPILSGILAFGFAPLEHYADFLDVRKGMNYFYVFLIDVAVSYTAFGMTKLVLALQRSKQPRHRDDEHDHIHWKNPFVKKSRARS